MQLIFLKPVFKEMVWGGNRLRSDFGYDIPGEDTGECWAIAAHPNGDCGIDGGPYDGRTLGWLWENHRELFGSLPGKYFPLLIKIIDARQDLSIQVHPDDAYAAEHENGSLGKTECWYILDADEGTSIVIGHHAKDKAEVRRMIEEKRWDEFIREIPVHKGDFFQIEPGTVHAIKGGTLILETQQNSDVTYRVYDYDRLQNGRPRELHIRKSIDVIRAPFTPQAQERVSRREQDAVIETLVSCRCYEVEKTELDGNLTRQWDAPFVNVSILDGEGWVDGTPVKKGTHLVIPSGHGRVTLSGRMMLITSTPAGF